MIANHALQPQLERTLRQRGLTSPVGNCGTRATLSLRLHLSSTRHDQLEALIRSLGGSGAPTTAVMIPAVDADHGPAAGNVIGE